MISSGYEHPNARVLFVTADRPLSPNAYGGGPALQYSHLELLASSGYEVDLLLLADPSSPGRFEEFVQAQPDVWQRVRALTRSIGRVSIERAPCESLPRRLAQSMKDPAAVLHPEITPGSLEALRVAVEEMNPSLIWAEHRVPALLAQRAATGRPVIYSHHDWQWRLTLLRARYGVGARRVGKLFWIWQMRRVEEQLVREVSGCVSGSATETASIKALRGGTAAYLPVTYQAVPLEQPGEVPQRPRVVHLGNMGATANKIGLQRFLEKVWPEVRARMETPPELWVIGELQRGTDALPGLLEEAGAVCTGFVPDLSTVLRPYDVHIIPWEHDTGTRTRLPVIFNHAQALVATKPGVGGTPEVKHGENALLADGLPELAETLVQACGQPLLRQRLGQAARRTFLSSFTEEALQPRLQHLAQACLPYAPPQRVSVAENGKSGGMDIRRAEPVG